jgi:WD40 repeat protein
VGYDGTVKPWDAAIGQEALTVRGASNFVCGVAYSPDGQHIASTWPGRTVLVYDGTLDDTGLEGGAPGTG